MTDGRIHVALSFDDNFWAPAFAVMRSIALFTHRRADLVFHLLQRGLSEEHRTDLKAITDEFGSTLVWYELDRLADFTAIAALLPSSKRLTSVIYARLMLDRLVDPAIGRILYLDCDMMVRAPIEELYEIDMQGRPIAAVRDSYFVGGRDIRNNRDLFDIADPYFNSGMLLIDLDRWREMDVLGRLRSAVADGTMARLYYDQDFLNLVFRNNWLKLDSRWNLLEAKLVHEAIDPAILHYTGPSKPWNLVSVAAFRRLYRHVMTNELFFRFMRHRWRRRLRRLVGRG